MSKKKICANCGAEMDRESKLCRKCYVKSVEKDPEEWRVKHNENCKKWRANNPEKARENARIAMQKYRNKNREVYREGRRFHRVNVRKDIQSFFGSICCKCGFSDWRALQIDHINGGGLHDPVSKGGKTWRFRKYIRDNPEEAKLKYQLLCANCNWIKRYEMNENSNNSKRIK
jgi:hypothetical protein